MRLAVGSRAAWIRQGQGEPGRPSTYRERLAPRARRSAGAPPTPTRQLRTSRTRAMPRQSAQAAGAGRYCAGSGSELRVSRTRAFVDSFEANVRCPRCPRCAEEIAARAVVEQRRKDHGSRRGRIGCAVPVRIRRSKRDVADRPSRSMIEARRHAGRGGRMYPRGDAQLINVHASVAHQIRGFTRAHASSVQVRHRDGLRRRGRGVGDGDERPEGATRSGRIRAAAPERG